MDPPGYRSEMQLTRYNKPNRRAFCKEIENSAGKLKPNYNTYILSSPELSRKSNGNFREETIFMAKSALEPSAHINLSAVYCPTYSAPASTNKTVTFGFSESLLARTHPAAPEFHICYTRPSIQDFRAWVFD